MKIPQSTPGIMPSMDGAKVTELPVATPGPGEVLIDVQASLATPETPRRTAVAGVVVALGEGVTPERMKRAERVAAFAEHRRYAVVKADQCIKLPHRVAFEVGLLVASDGLGLPFAALVRSGIRAGEQALVVGLNAAGLGAAVLLTHLGVSVAAADSDPIRRQSAHGLGVVRAVDPGAPEALQQLRTAAPRLTHAFACGAGSLGFAVIALEPGGTVACLGRHDEPLALDALLDREATLIACAQADARHAEALFALYRGGLPAEILISRRFHYADAPAAYQAAAAGADNVVLQWGEAGVGAMLGGLGLVPSDSDWTEPEM